MTEERFYKYHHRFGHYFRNAVHGYFTEYETPKLVLIHSLKFAVLLRILQIIILTYSIIYLLIYEKGYQKHDTSIISSVTLKVKGIGYIQTARNQTIVTDVADYIVPPSENNAIFIMTNFIRTDQSRSICPESYTLKEAFCQQDSDCQNRPFSPRINGRWTGRCSLSPNVTSFNGTMNVTRTVKGLCEYSGWCPAEDDQSPPMIINEVSDFTVFIKNFIEFPEFSVKHKNMVDELQVCVFDPNKNRDCPIFDINYMLNQAEKNETERKLMFRFGGVIRIKLDWDCNLDRNIKLCKPKYSFARLDVPFHERPFSLGFNFRYASHWKFESRTYRTLTKAFGLRFIIAVSGKAGKFDLITLTLNTGSIVGLFGLATFLCDIILLHLSKKS